MAIRLAPAIAALDVCGRDLHRPECVLGTAAGDVFVSDWRGGVTVLRADGSQDTRLARNAPIDLRPNGLARAPDGSFLLANLSEAGGVWRLAPDGRLTPFLTEIDGVSVPPANFVWSDRAGRTWISVSTSLRPRQRAWRRDVADGFVALVDGRGARIVADGLHYTNEVRVDPSDRWLYVVETFGRRVRRFPLAVDGRLGAPETVIAFEDGTFPDGFEFDASGGLWITSLVSNRLLRLSGDDLQTMIEDLNAAHVDEVTEAFEGGRMEARHLGPIPGTTLQHVTSVTFAGADRRTAYLGSLGLTQVHRFRSPVAGVAAI